METRNPQPRTSVSGAYPDDARALLAGHPVELFRCRSCGHAIEKERLARIPWSRVCALCARGPVGLR